MSQKMDDKHVKAQVQKVSCASEKPTWAHLVIVGVYMQWAQYYYLTIVSNGLSKFSKICCLWSRTGPAFPSELSVYCLEWAHHSSRNEVPRRLNGPTLLVRNATDIFEWAHCCGQIIPPMSMNGPTNSPDKCCRCH